MKLIQNIRLSRNKAVTPDLFVVAVYSQGFIFVILLMICVKFKQSRDIISRFVFEKFGQPSGSI